MPITKKKERIYRVLTEYHHADAPDIFYGKGVPQALPAAMKANFPQLEKVAAIYTEGNDQILVLDEAGQVDAVEHHVAAFGPAQDRPGDQGKHQREDRAVQHPPEQAAEQGEQGGHACALKPSLRRSFSISQAGPTSR